MRFYRLFPLDVLDGIWDLIESVSEGFLTYSFKTNIISARKRIVETDVVKDVTFTRQSVITRVDI